MPAGPRLSAGDHLGDRATYLRLVADGPLIWCCRQFVPDLVGVDIEIAIIKTRGDFKVGAAVPAFPSRPAHALESDPQGGAVAAGEGLLGAAQVGDGVSILV